MNKDSKLTKMLELAGKGFKASILTVQKHIKKNMLMRSEQIRTLSTETETIKKELNRNSRAENTTSELKNSLEEFNIRCTQVEERMSEHKDKSRVIQSEE